MNMENKITIQEIIEFVRKAMARKLSIDFDGGNCCYDYFWFDIVDSLIDKRIFIKIRPSENYLKICSDTDELILENFHIDKKEMLDLERLYLDCQEYSANNTYTVFKNFFKPEDTKPININDLDNEDD